MSLGIIGGMGPMATAVLYEKIIAMTEAMADQEHIETYILSCPQIPDRTAFILGESEVSPYPEILRLAKILQNIGVSAISIPCITAGFFSKDLEADINTPVLNGVTQTARYLSSIGIKKAGIMATAGSIRSGIIKDALADVGIEAIIPSEEDQKRVTSLIYDDVKTGKEPDLDSLSLIAKNLRSQGAQINILGCTELSVIAHNYNLSEGYFDILDMLSAISVKADGKELKKEYRYLLGE